jgi:hypothetical protein
MGAVVGTVAAWDADAGDLVTYKVSDSRFEIASGKLQLKHGVSLDYESGPELSLQITAIDKRGLQAHDTFVVSVGDQRELGVSFSADGTALIEKLTKDIAEISVAADGTKVIVAKAGDFVSINRDLTQIQLSDGMIDFSGHSSAAKASRIYEVVLGRDADLGGVSYWTDKLEHGENLKNVAQAFITSEEFKTRFGGLSDRQLVSKLYVEALGREGEESGIKWHVEQMKHGLSQADVIVNFVASVEAADNFEKSTPQGIFTVDTIARSVSMAYEVVLNRDVDQGGRQFWADALRNGAEDTHSLISKLLASEEFRVAHGGESDRQFIGTVYQNALGRDVDSEGMKIWSTHLSNHTMDRVDVAIAVGMSQEQEAQFSARPEGDMFGL